MLRRDGRGWGERRRLMTMFMRVGYDGVRFIRGCFELGFRWVSIVRFLIFYITSFLLGKSCFKLDLSINQLLQLQFVFSSPQNLLSFALVHQNYYSLHFMKIAIHYFLNLHQNLLQNWQKQFYSLLHFPLSSEYF